MVKIARLAALALLASCASLPPVHAPATKQTTSQATTRNPGSAPNTAPTALRREPQLTAAVSTVKNQGSSDKLNLRVLVRRPSHAVQTSDWHTQSLDVDSIQRVRAWVYGSGIGDGSESDRIWNLNDYVSVTEAGTNLEIEQVPRGKFRIVTVQGYDVAGQSFPEVGGATLKAVYDSPVGSTDVVLTFDWRSTLEAEVFQALLTQAQSNPTLMTQIENLDRTDLDALLDTLVYGTSSPAENATYELHPSLIDAAGIAADIVTNTGEVPSYSTENPVPADWLEPTAVFDLVIQNPQETAFSNSTITIQLSDPASTPIELAPGEDTVSVEGIPAGTWDAIVHIDGLNGGITLRAQVIVDAEGNVTLTDGGSEGDPLVLPPVLTAISDSEAVSGSQITLSGDGFDTTTPSNNIVLFNGVPATVISASDGSLVVEVPPGISGTVQISVSSNGETGNSTEFTVEQGITELSDAGAHAGDPLTLTLSGIDPSQAENLMVNFCANAECTSTIPASIDSTTGSTVTITIPAGAFSGPITISSDNNDTIQTGTFYVDEPNLEEFGPTSGAAGSEITLTGVNLDTVTSVTIGGVSVPLENIEIVDENTIIVTVPSNAASGPIVVTSGDGTSQSVGSFTVTPSIVSLSSSVGQVGSSLTINVSGFNPQTTSPTVVFSGNASASIDSSTSSSITVTVPIGAETGPITVTPSGLDPLQSGTYTVSTADPGITGISPRGGFVLAGTAVTISVEGFDPQTTSPVVEFCNDDECSSPVTATVGSTTATSISTTIPSGASSGSGPIRVTPTGIDTLESATFFINKPGIISITNASDQAISSASVGDAIKINGVNFKNASGPTVNVSSLCFQNFSKCINTFTTVTNTQITLTVPSLSSSSTAISPAAGPLLVSTNFGSGPEFSFSIN
ncbi:MAG: IPT/TIG domain-containing protein [Candidatus Sericytochromatia bacterium]